MATAKQKEAARRNLEKARRFRREHPHRKAQTSGLSSAEKNRLADDDFAFPRERKEPLTDAKHVRNVIARFDQVEGVSDREHDEAWRRIRKAARRFDVEVAEASWRELFRGGKATKKN